MRNLEQRLAELEKRRLAAAEQETERWLSELTDAELWELARNTPESPQSERRATGSPFDKYSDAELRAIAHEAWNGH
ncbi:MAG: hypothetical protein OJF60_003400 [Burkholderiaceae bacterium]|jgi:hypothetical protein|nr:MAG: hypothetical protein OJF60_003400 [Burkholderiaceae bacterium]